MGAAITLHLAVHRPEIATAHYQKRLSDLRGLFLDPEAFSIASWMDYEVVLTEPARDDLREIIAFIAQDNPHAAITFRDRLIAESGSVLLSGHKQ